MEEQPSNPSLIDLFRSFCKEQISSGNNDEFIRFLFDVENEDGESDHVTIYSPSCKRLFYETFEKHFIERLNFSVSTSREILLQLAWNCFYEIAMYRFVELNRFVV